MTIQPNHIINLAKQQTLQWHIYCIYKHIYDHFAEKQDITHICYLQGEKSTTCVRVCPDQIIYHFITAENNVRIM